MERHRNVQHSQRRMEKTKNTNEIVLEHVRVKPQSQSARLSYLRRILTVACIRRRLLAAFQHISPKEAYSLTAPSIRGMRLSFSCSAALRRWFSASSTFCRFLFFSILSNCSTSLFSIAGSILHALSELPPDRKIVYANDDPLSGFNFLLETIRALSDFFLHKAFSIAEQPPMPSTSSMYLCTLSSISLVNDSM